MSADWERGYWKGYAEGYAAALKTAQRDISVDMGEAKPVSKIAVPKRKRQPSAYNKAYSRAFKKVAPKFKKKNGGWVKNGFKRAGAAARKAIK
jgi:ribosomal protein L17